MRLESNAILFTNLQNATDKRIPTVYDRATSPGYTIYEWATPTYDITNFENVQYIYLLFTLTADVPLVGVSAFVQMDAIDPTYCGTTTCEELAGNCEYWLSIAAGIFSAGEYFVLIFFSIETIWMVFSLILAAKL